MRSKQMGNSRRGSSSEDSDRAERNRGIEDDRQLQDEHFDSSESDPSHSGRSASSAGPVLDEGEEVGQWSEGDEDQDELSAGSGSEEDDEASRAGSSSSRSAGGRLDDDEL